jgi:hypothetical protein
MMSIRENRNILWVNHKMSYVVDEDGVLYNGHRIVDGHMDHSFMIRHLPLTNVVVLAFGKGCLFLRNGQILNVIDGFAGDMSVDELDDHRIIVAYVPLDKDENVSVFVYDLNTQTKTPVDVPEVGYFGEVTVSNSFIVTSGIRYGYSLFFRFDPITLEVTLVKRIESNLSIQGFINGGTRVLAAEDLDEDDYAYVGIDIESDSSEPVFRIQVHDGLGGLGNVNVSESKERFVLIDKTGYRVRCFDSNGNELFSDENGSALLSHPHFDGDHLIVYATNEATEEYCRLTFSEDFMDGDAELLKGEPGIILVIPDTGVVLM